MDQDRPNIAVLPPIAFFATVLLTLALDRWVSPGDFAAIPRVSHIVVGILVMVAAFWTAVSGARAFKRAGTNINPHKPALNIVRDGPYRFTRNPMYLGMVLFIVGLGIAISTFWGLFVAGLLWALLHWGVVLREELYLDEKFGEAYRDLLSATRRWL